MLFAVAAAGFVISLGVGEYGISPSAVLSVLGGGGDRLDQTIVLETRVPRALGGIVVGAGLGMAGALTQSVARNALASPDVLGITSGASAMAVTIILAGSALGGGGYGSAIAPALANVGIPLSALLGALLVAVVIWLLAYRRGIEPLRLVLIGVAISALLQAYIVYLMAAADLRDATTARRWLSGSLVHVSWTDVLVMGVVVVVALGLAGLMTFRLSVLQLGPIVAQSLGGRVNSSQLVTLVVSVVLAAAGVATAGPIGFVAFVAPQVALRLAHTSAPPLVTSAAAGAALLTCADIMSRSILPWEIPVGIVTSAIGAPFLIYLVVQANRKVTV